MGNEKELVKQYKQKLKDYSLEDAMNSDYFDIVQFKYDGFWTLLEFDNSKMRVISSGGEVRHEEDSKSELDGTLIIAEWMFGTTWGNEHKKETGIEFVMFDLLKSQGKIISDKPYVERIAVLRLFATLWLSEKFFVAGIYKKSKALDMLEDEVEGVVFRSASSVFGAEVGRYKKQFTVDYVYMGFNDGAGKYEGTVGSLRGGLFVDGVLTPICSVGGLTDAQREEFRSGKYPVGSVFEASGKALFKSGALRHPAFLRIREDKSSEECVL